MKRWLRASSIGLNDAYQNDGAAYAHFFGVKKYTFRRW